MLFFLKKITKNRKKLDISQHYNDVRTISEFMDAKRERNSLETNFRRKLIILFSKLYFNVYLNLIKNLLSSGQVYTEQTSK